MTALQNSAFDGCTSLKKAVFLGNATQSFGNAFTETADDFTIYYYEGATGWTTPTWTASDGTVYNTVMIEVASEEVENVNSGVCGENLTWMLAGGILTISGNGPIKNFAYNEETEEYECMASMDEDEVMSFYTTKNCPAFRLYDEYGVVRKQN